MSASFADYNAYIKLKLLPPNSVCVVVFPQFCLNVKFINFKYHKIIIIKKSNNLCYTGIISTMTFAVRLRIVDSNWPQYIIVLSSRNIYNKIPIVIGIDVDSQWTFVARDNERTNQFFPLCIPRSKQLFWKDCIFLKLRCLTDIIWLIVLKRNRSPISPCILMVI